MFKKLFYGVQFSIGWRYFPGRQKSTLRHSTIPIEADPVPYLRRTGQRLALPFIKSLSLASMTCNVGL